MNSSLEFLKSRDLEGKLQCERQGLSPREARKPGNAFTIDHFTNPLEYRGLEEAPMRGPMVEPQHAVKALSTFQSGG